MELHQTELKKLSTPRLLALYRSKRKRRDNLYAQVTDYGTYPGLNRVQIRVDKYCDRIESVLQTREHVKRK